MIQLVVGASRGIGLELCKQLSGQGNKVIAANRTPCPELADYRVEEITGIDVARHETLADLAGQLEDGSIDLLIHNAGILTRETFEDLNIERIRAQFEVNAIGPLVTVHALKGKLKPGARIGIISSRVGSLQDNNSGGMYGYRMSKAAVNIAGVNLAHDLKPQDISVVLLHPGLVATDMTGEYGASSGIKPETAASGIIKTMNSIDISKTGTFWHAQGYQLPW